MAIEVEISIWIDSQSQTDEDGYGWDIHEIWCFSIKAIVKCDKPCQIFQINEPFFESVDGSGHWGSCHVFDLRENVCGHHRERERDQPKYFPHRLFPEYSRYSHFFYLKTEGRWKFNLMFYSSCYFGLGLHLKSLE